MPKPPTFKLNADSLGRYYSLGAQIKALETEREQLRRDIMEAMGKGKLPPADCPYAPVVDTQTRKPIPWAEEAKRWKELALKFGEALGKKPKELAKLDIDYPEIEVKVLRVQPKKDPLPE